MKKLSANAKRIIALPVLFILIAIFIALNGNDEGPFMYPAILFLFAFFIDLILIIVDGFKYINKKATHNYNSLDLSNANIDTHHYINLYDNIYTDSSNGEEITWARIILLCCVFFPIGLYFMFRKVAFEKLKYYHNGIKVLIYGTTLFLLCGSFSLWFFLSSGLSALILLVPSLFITVLGFALIIIGYIVKETGKTNNHIIKILFVDKITKVDNIALILRLNYFQTSKKIQRMIDNDILKNIYIHHQNHDIIINGISNKVAIKCKSCAGTTVLQENDEHICSYCGAKI